MSLKVLELGGTSLQYALGPRSETQGKGTKDGTVKLVEIPSRLWHGDKKRYAERDRIVGLQLRDQDIEACWAMKGSR